MYNLDEKIIIKAKLMVIYLFTVEIFKLYNF